MSHLLSAGLAMAGTAVELTSEIVPVPGPVVQASPLPLLAVLVPLAAALAIAIWGGRRARLRDAIALVGAAGGLALVAWIYSRVLGGEQFTWQLPAPFGTPLGLWLRFDGLGAVFGLVIGFVWLAATLYSWTYMNHEHDQNRYYVFLLVVLGTMTGVAGAGNFVTLLVFFELMSLTSYALVVHNQTAEALAAGDTYLYMGVFGGLSLLTGVVALQHFAGTTTIGPLAETLAAIPAGARWTIVGLLCMGFGIKAGMVPLHVWLPKAHPVAPSPASSLLSGIMIKAGAYGIARTIGTMLAPAVAAAEAVGAGAAAAGTAGAHAVAVVAESGYLVAASGSVITEPGGAAAAGWELARTGGTVLIWIAVATMLAGVVMALLQENAKRMLAYHSVSQMGYILLGIGIGAYLGPGGSSGVAGAILHLINHALFKACLFLAVGAVLLKTGEVNMYKLGGLWRYMPFTAAACLFAAAGIAGFPGLNGYASKTLLHHAVVELGHVGGGSLVWAERLFVVTGIGTAASFVKLFSLIFLGRAPEALRHRVREEWPLKAAMALLVGAIIFIGTMPNVALGALIGPSTQGLGLEPVSLAHTLEVNLFTRTDLMSVASTLILGTLLFVVGMKTGIFHWHGPRWLSVEWLALTGARKVGRAWIAGVDAWTKAIGGLEDRIKALVKRAARALPLLDYLPGRTETSREFNILNLDFDFYLVLTVIALVFALLGLWHLGVF